MTDNDRIASLENDCWKMTGYLSAIAGYLNNHEVPKVDKVHKRVKLFCTMYDQLKAENQRLKIMLDID